MTIKVNHVEFNYAKDKILNKISLNIAPGECLSIIGPNGAGKSTLIKCIDKLLSPQKGRIEIESKSLTEMNRLEIAKKLGYVPQSHMSLFPLKVFDMVLLGRRPHLSWRSSENDLNKVFDSLKILKIEQLATKNFNEISGGQQQKVIIARALAQETKIILLDEPISNLDIRHQLEVMELLKELSEKQKITIVIVVHDLNIAARYSDKIIMMNEGQIFAYGEPEEVLTKENILKVYGVEVEVGSVKERPYIVPLKAQYA